MSLTDEVRARPIIRWTRPVVDEHLGPDDAAELARLLADPSVIPQHIWHALQGRGIGVSESAVQKWAAMARTR